MPIPLVVLLYGLLAITVLTAVGRWCRVADGVCVGADGRPGAHDDRSPEPVRP